MPDSDCLFNVLIEMARLIQLFKSPISHNELKDLRKIGVRRNGSRPEQPVANLLEKGFNGAASFFLGVETMPVTQRAISFTAEPDVMEISGRLDDGTAPAIEEDALLCIRCGARRMVIDCHDLTYVTGAGMRSLLTVARAMRQADGRLIVCDLQPQVARMFAASGIDAMIPVYAYQSEAIASLAG